MLNKSLSVNKFGLNFTPKTPLYKNLGLNTRKKPKFLVLNQNKILMQYFKVHSLKYGKFLKNSLNQFREFLDAISIRRALRYKKSLPCRGQRTRSNGKTLRNYKKQTAFKKNKHKKIINYVNTKTKKVL